MVAAHHHHRPTLKQVCFERPSLSYLFDEVLLVILTQQNKRFKSKHAIKSSLKDSAKGLCNLSIVAVASVSFCPLVVRSTLLRFTVIVAMIGRCFGVVLLLFGVELTDMRLQAVYLPNLTKPYHQMWLLKHVSIGGITPSRFSLRNVKPC
jgi:hypothetical protein